MIDFYGGAGTFASWPQRVRAYAIETTPVNIRDWASAHGFALTPAALAGLAAPTFIMTGTASHPAARRANKLLSECVPGSAFTIIDGAAHFMIATHAGEVARLIARHIHRAEAGTNGHAPAFGSTVMAPPMEVRPPSATYWAPLMLPARSEHRNSTRLATSSAVP